MKLQISPGAAEKVRHWLKNRGGVAVWDSENLSNPGAQWLTPALTENGAPSASPTWQARKAEIVTNPDDITVVVPKLVRTLHSLGIRCSGNGLMFKLTDASSRRVRNAVARAGESAWYELEDRDCLIYVPEKIIPLQNF